MATLSRVSGSLAARHRRKEALLTILWNVAVVRRRSRSDRRQQLSWESQCRQNYQPHIGWVWRAQGIRVCTLSMIHLDLWGICKHSARNWDASIFDDERIVLLVCTYSVLNLVLTKQQTSNGSFLWEYVTNVVDISFP